MTALRVVRSTRHDYARLVAVHELVDAFVNGHIELAEALEQLRDIKRTHRTWPDWAVTLATALLAAAVAVMIGATLFTALVTLLVVLGVSTPLAGLVFVLDGVLIGAGDARYLAWTGLVNLGMYAPLLLLALLPALPHGGWALAVVWLAFAFGFLGARALTLGLRARSDAWMVLGATR